MRNTYIKSKKTIRKPLLIYEAMTEYKTTLTHVVYKTTIYKV